MPPPVPRPRTLRRACARALATGPMTVREIASHVGAGTAATATVLTALVVDGLATGGRTATATIQLTPAGHAQFDPPPIQEDPDL